MTAWPTHSDGMNKTVAEMTPEERAAVMAAAKQRFYASRIEE